MYARAEEGRSYQVRMRWTGGVEHWSLIMALNVWKSIEQALVSVYALGMPHLGLDGVGQDTFFSQGAPFMSSEMPMSNWV